MRKCFTAGTQRVICSAEAPFSDDSSLCHADTENHPVHLIIQYHQVVRILKASSPRNGDQNQKGHSGHYVAWSSSFAGSLPSSRAGFTTFVVPIRYGCSNIHDGKIPSSSSPVRDSECISVPSSHKDQKGLLDFLELGS